MIWKNVKPESVKDQKEKEGRIKEYNKAIRDIERHFGIKEPTSGVKPDKSTNDHESFIRSLRISYENDSEIKIQKAGKSSITYSCKAFGFRNQRVKAWEVFLDILKRPEHTYNIGPAYGPNGENTRQKIRLKSYDRELKRLAEISNKLRESFSRIFRLEIPENFKLYELFRSDKPGTYKFKFQIITQAGLEKVEKKYNRYDKDTLTKKFFDLLKGWDKNNPGKWGQVQVLGGPQSDRLAEEIITALVMIGVRFTQSLHTFLPRPALACSVNRVLWRLAQTF